MDPRKLQSAKFTPLNTSMTEVFMEIRRDPAFKWPSKLKGDPKRCDPQKYCEYHRDHGHLTEECITLRQEIENHIRNGRLVKFLAGERNQRRNEEPPLLEGVREAPRNREVRPREDRYAEPVQNQQAEPRRDREFHQPHHQDVVREIHTISGGLAGGGVSSSSRKAYARRTKANNEVLSVGRPLKIARRTRMAISFSEEDERGVIFPHDDALIVTLMVANHKIHRVLVDNGSSADILYWPVFKQMGVERSRIQPFDSPLVGFAGEQVQPMGLISLPVMVGTAPRQSTTMVDFLVIDRPSAYNAIIGRSSLNKLKAVTSTYHLMMKFPTEEGVGVVKGDQATARKCYNISTKKSEPSPLMVGMVGQPK
ncbi:uncharacterized protein LOC132174318 [Corylus avellana]|uniref:uncharacterized protein LOC132174318 n=1 Tax=Corylus avellana TaxID=13451 RepID=UPI00286B1477|nr:uncharacterized protein LOC132174318 [Corylus avellana]